jgi:hypothetical protein
MNDVTPKSRNRQRRYGLMMTDVEIFDALGIPEKLGRKAFRELDKPLSGTKRFPQPVPLFGGRRFWPAVERYFMEEFGGVVPDFTHKTDGKPPWQEDFDASEKTGRPAHAGPHLATSR